MVDYWYNKAVYYTLTNNRWNETGQATLQTTDIFYTADGQQVVIAGYNQVELRNVQDFSLQTSYSVQDGYFRTVDKDNGRFLWDPATGNSYSSLLIDLRTGKVLENIVIGHSYPRCLSGSHIISATGHQLNFPNPKE